MVQEVVVYELVKRSKRPGERFRYSLSSPFSNYLHYLHQKSIEDHKQSLENIESALLRGEPLEGILERSFTGYVSIDKLEAAILCMLADLTQVPSLAHDSAFLGEREVVSFS